MVTPVSISNYISLPDDFPVRNIAPQVKEVLKDQELDKVIGGMVILVSYSFEHKLPPRGGFFLPKNYSLSGSYVLRKFTAGQLAGTIFLLPIKNHMVRRALKLQRTCRPLTINEPYRQACGMALEKYFQQKNCPRQSPLQRCRASRRFSFLSNYRLAGRIFSRVYRINNKIGTYVLP